MANFFEYSIRTNKRNQFIDISSEVKSAIKKSGIIEGICIVHIPHTTAAVTINENADPAVTYDMDNHLSKMIPHHSGFTHLEGNSDSHIKTTLTGSSLTLIIHKNAPVLGTWQGIYFCEYDGPRSRQYYVKCMDG